MIRISICDDRSDQLEKIYSSCKAFFDKNPNYIVEISMYENLSQFLDTIERQGGCDIALLDICMPGISGVSVAKEIRKRKDHTEIVFLITSDEYAVEAFSVNAAHYLLKPFSQKDFDTAMQRVLEKITAVTIKKMGINGEGGSVHAINVNDIIYIESFRNGRSVYTKEEVYTETKNSLQTLLDNLEQICPGQFVSPYRGYIINYDAVTSISMNGITLKNNIIIPIKSGSYRKLRDSYFDWSFGEENKK